MFEVSQQDIQTDLIRTSIERIIDQTRKTSNLKCSLSVVLSTIFLNRLLVWFDFVPTSLSVTVHSPLLGEPRFLKQQSLHYRFFIQISFDQITPRVYLGTQASRVL